MIRSLEDIVQDVRSGKLDPEKAVEAFDTQAVHIKDVNITMDVEVIPCGLPTLDKNQFLKAKRSELIIIGARPSMGKSALMFQIGAYVAKHGNVLVYSLEMDKESIVRRLVASEAGKDVRKLALPVNLPEVTKARNNLNKLSLFVDDRGGLDVNTIKASAQTFNKYKPISLVIVDYLQLVKSRELGNRNNEVGEVTSGLKELAKSIGCPVVVGSQLNRECERRGKDQRSGNFGDFRPILSDLRDSGNIEQDADLIMFLSRQEVYDGTRPGTADIRIAKHRNGEVGDFVMKFSGALTQFFDAEEFI